jgi:hypothetical protein
MSKWRNHRSAAAKAADLRPESVSDLESRIIVALERGRLSKSELSRATGFNGLSGQLEKRLTNSFGAESSLTIPEKPGSRIQRCKLVDSGNAE